MAHMCWQTTESSHWNHRGHGTTYWEYLLPCCVFRLANQSYLTFWDPMDYSLPDSSVHRDSLGKNTGVGCHALLQRLFLTQGLNPDLPDCGQILYCLSHQGSPRILEWVAYPFSKGSSKPRNRTGVSRISGGFFTSWATGEACLSVLPYWNLLKVNDLVLFLCNSTSPPISAVQTEPNPGMCLVEWLTVHSRVG